MAEFEQLTGDMGNSSSAPYWQSQKQSSYKEIVLKQIETCRIEGSKQMVGESSYYQKDEKGNYNMVHLFDQKKIFIESIKMLEDLMLRYFDDSIKKNLSELEKQKKNLSAKYLHYYLLKEVNYQAKMESQASGFITKTNVGNAFIKMQEEEKMQIYRNIFRELLLLFDRKNELSGKKTVQLI